MTEFFLTFYNDWFSILIYILVLLAIVLHTIKKSIKNNNFLTASNLFIFFYYVFIAVAPLYMIIVKNYEYNYNILFIFGFSLICFIIGCRIISLNFVINNSRKKIKGIFNFDDVDYKNAKNMAFILLIIGYLFSFIYLIKNGQYIFQDLENNRVLAMQGSGIIIHFSYMILPATWMLYYYHVNFKKIKLLIIIICIDVIFLLLIGFRSRILELILLMILIRNDFKKIKFNKLFKYSIILIIFVSALQALRTYFTNGTMNFGIETVVLTLTVNSINLKSIFRVFPKIVPFQHGYTYLINFFMLAPNNSIDYTLWLKNALNISFDGGGVTPSILGEFFINFGFYGMFICMFILGLLTGIVDKKESQYKGNKLIYFIFIFYLARSVSSGIANFIIIMLWFIFLTLIMMRVKLGGKIKHEK